MRYAAIEFCEYTLTWRQTIEKHRVNVGVIDYDITPPDCSTVVTVLYADHNGTRILPITQKSLDNTIDMWRDIKTQQDVIQFYYLPDRSTLRFLCSPSVFASKIIHYELVYAPSVDTEVLPDILYRYHLDSICKGAKSRLFMMQGVEWTNPNLSVYYRTEFERAMKKEKSDRMNDYTRTSTLRIQPISY